MASTYSKTVVSLFRRLLVRKQNLQQRETRDFFSCGFCHSTPGNDQGARGTCQLGWSTPSGARRAGGERVFVEPLCLSWFCLFHTHHCDTTGSSKLLDGSKFIKGNAGEQVELDQRRKGESCPSFRLLICVSVQP